MAVIAVRRGKDAADPMPRVGSAVARHIVVGWVAAVAAAALFSALAFASVWRLHASDAPLRSGLETGLVLCALVSAVLLVSHFRQSRLLRDVLLLAALVTAAATNFIFNTLPGYGYETGLYGAGARSALTVLVAAMFLAVAYVPAQRRVEAGRRWVKLALPLALAWVALGEAIDLAVGPVRVQGSDGRFGVVATVIALVAFTGLVVAAYGLLFRRRQGDVEAVLLASAALMLAVVQLGRLTLAVIPPDWLTISDGLRAGTYLLVLTVSLRRHRDSQAQKALDAISAERQRIAQDLHDGLAQDLAFIALHSDRLALDYGSDHPLAIAAQRALAVSRGKILDLEGSAASDTEQALREVARELATRHAVEVDVRADRGRTLDYCPSDRRDLVRIAREAIVNAVKHGGARKIEVTLGSPQSELLLRIADDGRPLEPTSPRPSAGTGLGMQAMRSRAHSLGGRLIAEHHPGGGTEINVVKPNDGSNETVS